MAQNISTYISYPGFTMVGGATANVDVRLTDIVDMRVFLNQTWPGGTSATTGLACNLYPGTIMVPASAASFGGKDPNENPNDPIPKVISNPASQNNSSCYSFSTNYAPVTTLSGANAISNPPPSSGSSVSTSTAFFLNQVVNSWPAAVRIQLVNLDSTKSVQVSLLADI